MESEAPCPFCTVDASRVIAQSPLAIAFRDGFPVSVGHCLVAPRRHVASWFDTSNAERQEIMGLIDEARDGLANEHRPAGFNIGINDGRAAGQTVMHVHVQLIPRYPGDRTDPRGGVRWVLPDAADYWSSRS
jgi:diadenosine tetraphosphate (Ap4A) HIT family hydrolase